MNSANGSGASRHSTVAGVGGAVTQDESGGPIRVLLMSAIYENRGCGIADYTAHLGRGIQALGCQVEWAACGEPPADAHTLPLLSRRIVGSWSMASVLALARDLAHRDPTIVHLQYPGKLFRRSAGVALAPLVFRAVARVPFVSTLHVLSKMRSFKKPPFIGLALTSNGTVVTAPAERAYLARYGVAHRSIVVPIASNFRPGGGGDVEPAMAERLGIPPGVTLGCTFGLIEANKRLERVLEALSQVSGDVHWVFLGPFDPERDAYHRRLQTTAESLGLAHRVHWAGYRSQPEVEGILRLVDLAVLLYPDGISWQRTALIAAMERGLAVVANAGKDTPPDLAHGQTLLLVSDDRVESLAACIRRLQQDSRLREALRAAARQLAASRPDWVRVAEMHVELYRQFARGTRPRGSISAR